MTDLEPFRNLRLRGGFYVSRVEFVSDLLVDPMGRQALAKTEIMGRLLSIQIRAGLDDAENSVTIFHEILEAMTLAAPVAPAGVQDFNEGDFEKAGYDAHRRFGTAAPEALNRMLQFYGFEEN